MDKIDFRHTVMIKLSDIGAHITVLPSQRWRPANRCLQNILSVLFTRQSWLSGREPFFLSPQSAEYFLPADLTSWPHVKGSPEFFNTFHSTCDWRILFLYFMHIFGNLKISTCVLASLHLWKKRTLVWFLSLFYFTTCNLPVVLFRSDCINMFFKTSLGSFFNKMAQWSASGLWFRLGVSAEWGKHHHPNGNELKQHQQVAKQPGCRDHPKAQMIWIISLLSMTVLFTRLIWQI